MITISLEDASSEALQELLTAMRKVADRQVFPITSQRVYEGAELLRGAWAEWAMGEAALSNVGKIDKPSEKLARSIKIKSKGAYSVEVYTNSMEMEKIQNGIPDSVYDMKKTYPYGRKSRVSKKGIPYLIIPFRWGTSTKRSHFNNFIPMATYKTLLKGMDMSIRTKKTHLEKNYKGENIERSEYEWGTRLKTSDKFMNGLVRMTDDTSTKKIKSTYFTFRIISAKSPPGSWIREIKGKKGLDVTGALLADLKEVIVDNVMDGLRQDLLF